MVTDILVNNTSLKWCKTDGNKCLHGDNMKDFLINNYSNRIYSMIMDVVNCKARVVNGRIVYGEN